jgi:very-short-patch-repair endonuclease
LLEFAKEMRREMTEPERRLWYRLRAKRFGGAKFRRQQVIGRYIADFACRSPMLVIEVDGETHAESAAVDALRTAYLSERGYRVLRFLNTDIMRNMDGVLTVIGGSLLSPSGERREPRSGGRRGGAGWGWIGG